MHSIMNLQFLCWSKWEDRATNLINLNNPGIYALIISKNDINDEPFAWLEEIVYFGMTNSVLGLKGRLSQFDNSLRNKSDSGHGGADRFRFDYHDGNKLAKKLYVAVCPFMCKVSEITPENLIVQGKVAMAEYLAFAEYFQQFGRLPKYNNKKTAPKLSKVKIK
jgi:hypothetical protein